MFVLKDQNKQKVAGVGPFLKKHFHHALLPLCFIIKHIQATRLFLIYIIFNKIEYINLVRNKRKFQFVINDKLSQFRMNI